MFSAPLEVCAFSGDQARTRDCPVQSRGHSIFIYGTGTYFDCPSFAWQFNYGEHGQCPLGKGREPFLTPSHLLSTCFLNFSFQPTH